MDRVRAFGLGIRLEVIQLRDIVVLSARNQRSPAIGVESILEIAGKVPLWRPTEGLAGEVGHEPSITPSDLAAP